jgi:hypothetical protein
MGIKGTVRRSIDSNFIHTNIDIDLIITEETEYGKPDKPEEIFHIIEHFCLGKRRLYLFGRDNTIRHGWLTVGPELSDTNFDKEIFRNSFDMPNNGNLTGTSEKIEMLRPKTPPPKQAKQPTQPTLTPSQSQMNLMEQVGVVNNMITFSNDTLIHAPPQLPMITKDINQLNQNEFEMPFNNNQEM